MDRVRAGGYILAILGLLGQIPVTIAVTENSVTTPIQLLALTDLVLIVIGPLLVGISHSDHPSTKSSQAEPDG